MKIIPAIDIQNGNCVRLRQGDFSQETIFHSEPIDIAELSSRCEQTGGPAVWEKRSQYVV